MWIIESGSTKSNWVALDDQKVRLETTQQGFNPYHHDRYDLVNMILSFISNSDGSKSPDSIHHYCAGADDHRRSEVADIWRYKLPFADINVYSDIMALAHGLTSGEPGWLGILGTGSNLAHFNGALIDYNIPSLGWMLGDEGSSRDIAKEILKRYGRSSFSENTTQHLKKILQFDPEKASGQIQDFRVFKEVIDLLADSLSQIINTEEIKALAHSRIAIYIDLLPVNETKFSKRIHLTGSIAYFHSSFIENYLGKIGYQCLSIDRYPIKSLINYYVNKNQ
ncbi:MAG: hypothetical protein R3275_05530 [Saprospiraceae bacterium]|nr:hypothetical protein [Saprospiraceae bacterium]